MFDSRMFGPRQPQCRAEAPKFGYRIKLEYMRTRFLCRTELAPSGRAPVKSTLRFRVVELQCLWIDQTLFSGIFAEPFAPSRRHTGIESHQ
jgi:hypothetical protein